MNNAKEIREVQLSRWQLLVVLVLVLALGAFIFVLGVSVGKKQAGQSAAATPASPIPLETVKPTVKTPQAADEVQKSAPSEIQKEIASFKEQEKTAAPSPSAPKSKPSTQPVKETPPKPKPAPVQNTASGTIPPPGLYYIQVVAATQKTEAERVAESIRKLGFSVYVLNPLPADRTNYFRVRVGGFRTEAERTQAAERLAASLGKKTSDFYYPPK